MTLIRQENGVFLEKDFLGQVEPGNLAEKGEVPPVWGRGGCPGWAAVATVLLRMRGLLGEVDLTDVFSIMFLTLPAREETGALPQVSS